MATEILVNDGGAPARILPFKAGEDVVAGEPVMVEAVTGDIVDTIASYAMTGIAFNTAADGEMVNVITGSGVIVRALCDQNASPGDYLTVAAGSLLGLANAATSDDAEEHVVAICLEQGDTSSGSQLLKVLLK
jgi:hypothetical protein